MQKLQEQKDCEPVVQTAQTEKRVQKKGKAGWLAVCLAG
jgi:hypothetical protein